MTTYAEGTTVSAEKSRGEIERTLARFGATGFAYGWDETRASVQFVAQGRQVRFVMTLPDPSESRFTMFTRSKYGSPERRSLGAAKSLHEAEVRRLWRVLALAVKAKLSLVEAEIVSFEQEFLAFVVLPSGRTVYEETHAAIASAYDGNQIPALLPGGR